MVSKWGLVALLLIICYFASSPGVKLKDATAKVHESLRKVTNKTSLPDVETKQSVNRNAPHAKISRAGGALPTVKPKEKKPKMITPELVQGWANMISADLHEKEAYVRREMILKSFSDVKIENRNGAAIVEKTAEALEALLKNRIKAAEKIMRKAEDLAYKAVPPPETYNYTDSVELDVITQPDLEKGWEKLPLRLVCREPRAIPCTSSKQFDSRVAMDHSSVFVAREVFDCDFRVLPSIYWSEGLLATFKENYAEDGSTSFQYFCSAKGFLRHYPAATWSSMFKLDIGEDSTDVYDCRLRPWYVAAGGAPRDVLILIDASGSMENSSNLVIAEKFTLALLSALTDDDQVNVLRFNVTTRSPISCFNDMLLSANHVNSAAMMEAMKGYKRWNETKMDVVLKDAVTLLKKQYEIPGREPSCQQAIVLLTDSLEINVTEKMQELDPDANIRLFIVWLHDPYGLRDKTARYSEEITCLRDGLHAEMITHANINEQVLNILQVMERPLVAQRKERLRVISDVYAHVEDPRRGEYAWNLKENKEQRDRYMDLHHHKQEFLNDSTLMRSYRRQLLFDSAGHYYEEENVNYRLQISVSLPVFDHITIENITKPLFEVSWNSEIYTKNNGTLLERIEPLKWSRLRMCCRISCPTTLSFSRRHDAVSRYARVLEQHAGREYPSQRFPSVKYPVNRLLGVAGIDIPLDDLKLILPYHELGAGGSLFLLDHRGNIVVHDNLKPTFDGNILRPGYRTVDFLDIEQPAAIHKARYYPPEWVEFRNEIVVKKPNGNRTMRSKSIFEHGMRALLEPREYYWRRVLDHYTAVVVLPMYGRRHAVPDASFTQQLAEEAYKALAGTNFVIQPDWLYCRHVEQYFSSREHELLYFIMRRRDEANFPMKNLRHLFSPIKLGVTQMTYQCNEKLVARLCKEAVATAEWAREHETPAADAECSYCALGSITAFFATENGLTRWQLYHAVTSYAKPPRGDTWSLGPLEPWYKRAVAAPDTLIIHAPVAPKIKLRNSYDPPPDLGERYEWLTAAKTLRLPGEAIVGVAGYHFYPQHFQDLIKTVTNSYCSEEDPDKCDPRCDGESWVCVVVDENGWVVGGHPEVQSERNTVRQNLATLHPGVMAKLLSASVYKLYWVHDYQAVCFPYQKQSGDAVSLVPTLMRMLAKTVHLLMHVAREIFSILALISLSGDTQADTKVEIEKRRNRLRKDLIREKYETMYDPRVLVNRTFFMACDRSRPLYQLQRTSSAFESLKRPPSQCDWPLVGALVPKTNLLLLAIYKLCPVLSRPVPDPLVNEQVEMNDEIKRLKTTSERLACWRNQVPFPARKPNLKCFPHNYAAEEGYRQCGPWIPDPEPEENGSHQRSFSPLLQLLYVPVILFWSCP